MHAHDMYALENRARKSRTLRSSSGPGVTRHYSDLWVLTEGMSRNSPVSVTLTYGPRYLLFLRHEILILVLFFI
jgi:hypothetical protein